MPSLQPEIVPSNPEAAVPQNRLSLAVVLVPLLASVVGNIVQLTGAANERRESLAKIEGLRAERRMRRRGWTRSARNPPSGLRRRGLSSLENSTHSTIAHSC